MANLPWIRLQTTMFERDDLAALVKANRTFGGRVNQPVAFLCDRCGRGYRTTNRSPICAGCTNGLMELQRKGRELQPWQLCPRCQRPLISESFKDENGDYRLPRGWISKNIHLDHNDESDTKYNGLVHASCNLRAARRRKRER